MVINFLLHSFYSKTNIMFTKKCIVFFLLLATCASCGNNKTAESTTTTTTTVSGEEAGPATASPSGKAPTAKVHVVVGSGPHAGTYDASCPTACCSYEIAGDNIFGNQYSETGKKPNELSSVQLVVNDVTGNKTTNEFLITVSFGDMLKGDMVSYTIDTQNGRKEGSGTLDLKYANNQGTVQVKGKTKEGVALDVTLNCTKVYTAQMLTDEVMQEQ